MPPLPQLYGAPYATGYIYRSLSTDNEFTFLVLAEQEAKAGMYKLPWPYISENNNNHNLVFCPVENPVRCSRSVHRDLDDPLRF